MAPVADARALVDAINQVEARFRVAFPEAMWLFFEPDHVA